QVGDVRAVLVDEGVARGDARRLVERLHRRRVVAAAGGLARAGRDRRRQLLGVALGGVHVPGRAEPLERLARGRVLGAVAEGRAVLADRVVALPLPFVDDGAVVVRLRVERRETDGRVELRQRLVVAAERAERAGEARVQVAVVGMLADLLGVGGGRLG